jgi:RimJ/RimL family protein N-acetyltransferase
MSVSHPVTQLNAAGIKSALGASSARGGLDARSGKLVGELCFETFDECFCELSWAWLNDPEIKQLTMTPSFTREDQLRWFAGLSTMTDYRIWGVRYEVSPIGAVGLKKVTAVDGEYWGYIGERRFWGLGLGQRMIDFVLGQARSLGLREVYLHVSQENLRAIALYKRCGFELCREQAGVLRMHLPLNASHAA